MPAHVSSKPLVAREPIPRSAKALFIIVVLIATAVYFRQWVAPMAEPFIPNHAGQNLLAMVPQVVSAAVVSEPADKPVRLKFDPPFPLSQEQRDFQAMAKDVITNPGSWGVYKPPLNYDPNLLELYTGGVLWGENGLSHYDRDGNIAVSSTGCCYGGAQVSRTTSVCSEKEISDQRYNLWCGAAIFLDYYNEWAPKAGSRANEITVAVYKNAIELNDDRSIKLGKDGLPIIPPDDPDDPYDFASQVASAFMYDGKSLYKFIRE